MGMCPEEMERWGTASIFKESARLLHKHYRLFLPLFLVFYLLMTIAGVFQTVIPPTSSTPLLHASIVNGSVNTALTTDPPGDQSFTSIFSLALLLIFVVGTLGTGVVSYNTAYCKARFDAAGSAGIPVFQRIDWRRSIHMTRLWRGRVRLPIWANFDRSSTSCGSFDLDAPVV